MTLIRPSLDYTDKDFDALRARLFNIIPSAFPDWTDTQIADFGNLLVEMFAFVGDVLTYYQDNQAQESRWTTARLRRSLLSMAKMIYFTPRGASAAQASLMLKLAVSPIGSVQFAAGDVFTTLDVSTPLRFQAISTVTMPAGTDPPVIFIDVEHSEPTNDTFVSTGLPNQTYLLPGVPFLDDSLVVTAADGVYQKQKDLLSSTSTSKHYVIAVDENSRATVTFGNGIAGSIPSGNIAFVYKTGGGVIGNVAQNTIKKALSSYSDNFGNAVSVTVTNPAKAGGGSDAQTVESIRESGPRSLTALVRTIAREDYETNALRVAGVARALMLSRDETPAIQENQGRLYIVPEGGGFATETLLSAVRQKIEIEYPKGITFKTAYLSASYLVINVSTRIHLAKKADPTSVSKAIKTALTAFFSINAPDGSENSTVDFGYYMDGAIAWSDVFNVIRDTSGVRKIDDGLANLTLNDEADDLTVPFEKFPVLGTVTVIDAVSGTVL